MVLEVNALLGVSRGWSVLFVNSTRIIQIARNKASVSRDARSVVGRKR